MARHWTETSPIGMQETSTLPKAPMTQCMPIKTLMNLVKASENRFKAMIKHFEDPIIDRLKKASRLNMME